MLKKKTVLLMLALGLTSTLAMAGNRWYMVSAQCSTKENGGDIYEYVAVTEGNGQEGAQDDARFGFARTIERDFAGKTCYSPTIETRNSKASYVGDSRQEAEGYLQKYVKKELAKKNAWYHLKVLDYDAAKRVATVRGK